jgi:hypothetical protein
MSSDKANTIFNNYITHYKNQHDESYEKKTFFTLHARNMQYSIDKFFLKWRK